MSNWLEWNEKRKKMCKDIQEQLEGLNPSQLSRVDNLLQILYEEETGDPTMER